MLVRHAAHQDSFPTQLQCLLGISWGLCKLCSCAVHEGLDVCCHM